MDLDFFKDGNELKQKSREEIIRDIDDVLNKNEKIINEMMKREKKYFEKTMDNLYSFLTEDLSFVLISDKNDNKKYKFVKNNEEYLIEISSMFIKYSKPKKQLTYSYSLCYKKDKTYFQSLKSYEPSNSYSVYSTNYRDISEYLKDYKNSIKIFEENTKAYNEIKDLKQEELFVFRIKESSCSMSRYDTDCEEYDSLVDFIKRIL